MTEAGKFGLSIGQPSALNNRQSEFSTLSHKNHAKKYHWKCTLKEYLKFCKGSVGSPIVYPTIQQISYFSNQMFITRLDAYTDHKNDHWIRMNNNET